MSHGRIQAAAKDTTTKVRSAGHEEAISFDEGLVASMQKELSIFPTSEGFYDYKNNEYIYQYKPTKEVRRDH